MRGIRIHPPIFYFKKSHRIFKYRLLICDKILNSIYSRKPLPSAQNFTYHTSSLCPELRPTPISRTPPPPKVKKSAPCKQRHPPCTPIGVLKMAERLDIFRTPREVNGKHPIHALWWARSGDRSGSRRWDFYLSDIGGIF